MSKTKLPAGLIGDIARAAHLPGWKSIKEAEVEALAAAYRLSANTRRETA